MGNGNGANVNISVTNLNPYSFTADVVITLENTATVILEHMSLADISSVAGQIELV